MSKPKIWTLPALLDRIWAAIPISNKTAVICDKDAAASVEALRISLSHLAKFGLSHAFKRVVTGWDEDYKPRTYELNKISAASAAALYERIKTMRVGSVVARNTAGAIHSPWVVAQQICPVPEPVRPPVDPYKKQLDEWADEVQARGGL